MNKELMEALDILEKEKEISKETLFEAIENSLITACKNHFGKSDNVKVEINRETCDFLCYAEKEVVEVVEDDLLQISEEEAKKVSKKAKTWRCFKCRNQIQRIWTYCNSKCKKCDTAENQRRRTQRNLQQLL